MKSWIHRLMIVSVFVLAGTSLGFAQANDPKRLSMWGGTFTPNAIPACITQIVLTEAAPQFNESPGAFISMFYSCGCITVQALDPETFLVVHGGVGIQIVIDATRVGAEEEPEETALPEEED